MLRRSFVVVVVERSVWVHGSIGIGSQNQRMSREAEKGKFKTSDFTIRSVGKGCFIDFSMIWAL
jgi:hypothetical protein